MSTSEQFLALFTLVLICATFLMGIQLKLEYLVDVLRRPRALLVGAAGQFLLLPALAVAFHYLFPLRPGLDVVWFILAASPGRAFSNVFAIAGGGRLSLSVVLTACSTLAAVVTVPLWLSVGMAVSEGTAGQELPIATMVWGGFGALVVPLALGIALGAWRRTLAERLRRPTRIAMLGFIVVTIPLYTAARWDLIAGNVDAAMIAGAVMFFVTLVAVATIGARLAGLDHRDRFTIGVEVGVQNIVVAGLLIELIDRPDLLPFLVYYGLSMFGLALLWMAAMARFPRPSVAPPVSPSKL